MKVVIIILLVYFILELIFEVLKRKAYIELIKELCNRKNKK